MNVERLLAIAMGWIGMSRKDFELCTPSEFTEIYNAWMERDLQKQQRAWERMRWQSACLLQPYCKKVLQPKDLVRFDWEEEEKEDAEKKEERKRLTREEVMARYEMLKKRMGLR